MDAMICGLPWTAVWGFNTKYFVTINGISGLTTQYDRSVNTAYPVQIMEIGCGTFFYLLPIGLVAL